MWTWLRENAALLTIVTTGMTALAASATFLYNVWQDHRRLKITITPPQWTYGEANYPNTDKRFRVSVFTKVHAHNRGKTPNRIVAVTALRDGEALTSYQASVAFPAVELPPYDVAAFEYQIVVFESVRDPEYSFKQIKRIQVEVKAIRGRRKVTFSPDAFTTL